MHAHHLPQHIMRVPGQGATGDTSSSLVTMLRRQSVSLYGGGGGGGLVVGVGFQHKVSTLFGLGCLEY